MQNLQKHIIDEFSSEETQSFYEDKARAGFWPSEEAVVAKYIPNQAKVLDVGCGTGRTTLPLAISGRDVIGLDITPAMIKKAKQVAEEVEQDIEYREGDAAQLEFPDSSFDAVLFSNNGWTQIPGSAKRQKALHEIYRVLKPGGVFIFTTHVREIISEYFFAWVWLWLKMSFASLFKMNIREKEWGDRFFAREGTKGKTKDKQYIHIPTPGEVKKQITDIGFKLMEMKRSDELAPDDPNPSRPMFYVCRK